MGNSLALVDDLFYFFKLSDLRFLVIYSKATGKLAAELRRKYCGLFHMNTSATRAIRVEILSCEHITDTHFQESTFDHTILQIAINKKQQTASIFQGAFLRYAQRRL